MGEITVGDAEDLAERAVEACNRVLRDGDLVDLTDLLTPDAVIEIAEIRTDVLSGPDELAARLSESAHHGGLVLLDCDPDGGDVVAGVGWEDDPTVRAAEVRLVPDGDRIRRIEWVQ